MLQESASFQLGNPRLKLQFERLKGRIDVLNEKHSYGSPIENITSYAEGLGKELAMNPSRSIYLDNYIRRNELQEDEMKTPSPQEEALESSSFKLFENLFDYLNELIQIRYDMVPSKGKKPVGTNGKLLDQKRPLFDKAIITLSESLGVFMDSLSNQSKDFVEIYIKDHTELVQRFMHSNMPKSKIRFRPLLGLDMNTDGSKREKLKSNTATKNKATTVRDSRLGIATQDEGKFYRIRIPRKPDVIYAEKISKTYRDGSARFRPTDAQLLNSMKKLSRGKKDFMIAYVESN